MKTAPQKRRSLAVDRRNLMTSMGALALASAGFNAEGAKASEEEGSELFALIAEHNALDAKLTAIDQQRQDLERTFLASLRGNPIFVVLGPGEDQTLHFRSPGIDRRQAVHRATTLLLVNLSVSRSHSTSLRDQLAWVADTEERNLQLVDEAEEALVHRRGSELRDLDRQFAELIKARNEALDRVRNTRPKNFEEVRAYIDHMGSGAAYGRDFAPTEEEVNEIFAALSTSGLPYVSDAE